MDMRHALSAVLDQLMEHRAQPNPTRQGKAQAQETGQQYFWNTIQRNSEFTSELFRRQFENSKNHFLGPSSQLRVTSHRRNSPIRFTRKPWRRRMTRSPSCPICEGSQKADRTCRSWRRWNCYRPNRRCIRDQHAGNRMHLSSCNQ